MFLTDDEMTDVIHYLSGQLDKEQLGIPTLLNPLVTRATEELHDFECNRIFDAISYYCVSALLDNDFRKATFLLGIHKNNLEDPRNLILKLPLRVCAIWFNSEEHILNDLNIQPIPCSMEELLKLIK